MGSEGFQTDAEWTPSDNTQKLPSIYRLLKESQYKVTVLIKIIIYSKSVFFSKLKQHILWVRRSNSYEGYQGYHG